MFHFAGEFERDIAARTIAIEHGAATARAFMSRGVSRFNTGRREEGREDMISVLKSHDGTIFEFGPAMQVLMSDLKPESIALADELFQSASTPIKVKQLLAQILMADREKLSLVADKCLEYADDLDLRRKDRSAFLNTAQLALIGSQRFAEALAMAERLETASTSREGRLAATFNRAMAAWGSSGSPSVELFGAVDALIVSGSETDANAHQCFALVHSVLGRSSHAAAELVTAERRLVASSGPVFSCWRYLNMSEEDFEADLNEMRATLERGDALMPPFIAKATSTN